MTDGAIDSLDVAKTTGTVIATTSDKEIKILDANGALSESLAIEERVSLAKFAPNSDSIVILVFAAAAQSSEDNVVKAQVWDIKSKQKVYEIKAGSQEEEGSTKITDISFTPLSGHVAVSFSDQSWSLHDYTNGVKVLELRESAKVTSLRIHPDGLIMAIGLSNGKINVYDIRDMKLAKELESPSEETAVSKLEFSNKGIFLAAAWAD